MTDMGKSTALYPLQTKTSGARSASAQWCIGRSGVAFRPKCNYVSAETQRHFGRKGEGKSVAKRSQVSQMRDLAPFGLLNWLSRCRYACWCSVRSRSLTVLTGLKVVSGTSTKAVSQSLMAPFHSPGRSSALSSRPSLDL